MKVTVRDYKDEKGQSGVSIYSGRIYGEEYNPDLVGRRGMQVWEQMRKSDSTVKASLKAVKLPIKSAEYRIDAASEEQQDVDAQLLVQTSLFEFIDWKKFLGEGLTSLEFGFSLFEMVFEPRYVGGKLRLALVKLGFRKQLSVFAWQQQDASPGITQLLSNGSSISIPIEKLVHIANEQEGDNYEGVSILRTAYKHWKMKDNFYKIDAVGAENQALGIADITYPKGAQQADKDRMEQWAKARRANEVGYIMKPDGWDVSIMDMQAPSLKDLQPSIEHHDSKILMNVLAQFLGQGTSGSSSGSRAVSEDHSRLFIKAVKEVADNLIFAVQRTAIKTLVDLNFTTDVYPTLSVGNISDENIKEVTEGIKIAVEAGILHPGVADENVVRKMLSLPEEAAEELEKRFAEKKTGATPAASKEASVIELRALRASVEKELYEPADQAA